MHVFLLVKLSLLEMNGAYLSLVIILCYALLFLSS